MESKKHDIEEDLDFDYTGHVYNLAAALSCLEEIDGGLMNKSTRETFDEIKDRIFNGLEYYSSMLPESEEK